MRSAATRAGEPGLVVGQNGQGRNDPKGTFFGHVPRTRTFTSVEAY